MTATPAPSRCTRCQAELPAGKEHGHCPRCLLELAMPTGRGADPASRSTAARGAPAPAIETLQPLLPDYELQTLLGRGGMGAVYRARHKKLDRLVAIKVLLPDLVGDPTFAERFEREARTLAMLQHPGIVGIHDFGRAGEFFFLVMEFVDGATLRELLAQGRLTARDVLAFVPQLCDALQYAHDRRIVHRDIKPENILIDQDGRVHIADFGLAKLLGQEDGGFGLTATHQALGTPHYMAPEQVHAGAVDHRADLYSLGVVVYEMLTGSLPIGRFAPPSAKAAEARAFDPVVLRSLENDPARRYQQARDVKGEVESAAQPAAPGRREATRPEQRQALPGTLRAIALPWRAWAAAAWVWVLTLPPWLIIAPSGLGIYGEGILRNSNRMHFQASAWNTSLLGIPCASVLAAAVMLAILATRRWATRVAANGPSIAIAASTAVFCAVGLGAGSANNYVSFGPGMVLAFLTFAVWTVLLVRDRYLDPDRWQRRRARRADRRSRAAT